MESSDKPSVSSINENSQRQWSDLYSTLRNSSFLFLWLGTVAMMASINMQMIARGFLTFELTNSAKIVGYVGASGGIPMLVLSLYGGAIADRVERKIIIQVGQVLSTSTAVIITIMLVIDQVTWIHLMVASAIQGTGWAFLGPARRAIIPQVVGKNGVGNAIALDGAALSATTLVAPAIAGVLYAVIGPKGVYVIVTMLGICALICTTLVPRQGVSKREFKSNVLQDILDGLRYLKQNQLVRMFLVFGLASVMLIMPFRSLIPVIVVEIYGLKSEAFGLLISMMGLGSLVGSILIAYMGHWKRGILLIGGGIVSAISLILVAVIPIYLVAAVLMIVIGLGEATRRVINMSLIMEHTDDQYQGRVTSLMMMTFGLMPFGLVPAGWAMDVIGSQAVVGIFGALMLIFSISIAIAQPQLRRIS